MKFKRGDTWDFSGTIDATVNGSPVVDMTGWTGESQIRTERGVLVAAFTFSWVDATQRLARIRCADTTAWPIGRAKIDIQLTMPSGDRVSTDTQYVDISEDVTRV